MRLRLAILAIVPAAVFLLLLGKSVMAQEPPPPPPYVGMKNPFAWDNASAQAAGKAVYQRSCLGCHGVAGDNLPGANFAATGYSSKLEGSSDLYFWILSEGKLDKGMPPFKSSLPEDQRWQSLSYIWTFSNPGGNSGGSSLVKQAKYEEGNTLLLSVPEKGQAGQPLTVRAVLTDAAGAPIATEPVKFFAEVDFFIQGLMEIGEAVTDNQGAAVYQFTPRFAGDVRLTAVRGGNSHEAAAVVQIADSSKVFYIPHVGLSAPGKDLVFIGPKSAMDLGEEGRAPKSALRIPGGLRAVLLLAYVFTVITVWSMYLRVMYLLRRISLAGGGQDSDAMLVPVIGLAVLTALVTMLVLILITGPYSHFNVMP